MRKHRIRAVALEHPFELFVSLLCFLVGSPIAFGEARPTSVGASLPAVLQHAWGASLAVGGLLSLAGLISRAFREDWFRGGMAFERAGMNLLASATFVYALVLVLYAPVQNALVTISLLLALSASCIARSVAIRRVLRKLADPRVKGADDGS